MNKNWCIVCSLLLTTLLGGCAQHAKTSPVGSWRGTLTTTEGGSRTQLFNAKITEADGSDDNYEAVFSVGSTIYNVTGFYNGTNVEGDIFIFEIPLEDLQPTVSPIEFDGMMWSGPMTDNNYSGGWFVNRESGERMPAGDFNLERQPTLNTLLDNAFSTG